MELTIHGRVGRPASGVDRKVQLANAQKKKRLEDKKDGLKPINVSVAGDKKSLFNALCEIHKMTQREVMEALIDRAIRNGSIM
ncbi:TPA: hypothetical protein R2K44_002380 [Raoultella ornithinolytica]|nr:hypothetical protein [Raoultella ornithinolytica]